MKLMTMTELVFLAAAMTAGGCGGAGAGKPQALPQAFVQPPPSAQEAPVGHIVRRDYRLREGDQLEIIYHVRHESNEEYRIELEDVIVIRFPFNPQLNQTEQVQSDGTLHLDLLAEPVRVVDRTIQEVQADLTKQYARYIRDPMLTVSFKQSNVKIAELKEAIKTAPRGQSRLVPIAPDGNISLPFVADARAAGMTVGELHRQLNEAYRRIGLEELEVTVNIQQVMPFQVYVMGEVRIPGALLNRTGLVSSNSELTLLQAIAQAGSYIPARAELSRVMLVRRRHLDRPQIAIINLHQLLENRSRNAQGEIVADSSNYRYDLWLEDGDIIYVPTSMIARRADYIEYVWSRGIRAVPGFTSSASYTVGDGVNWLPN
jgi:polysaccharide export outer membrane protein